MWSGLKGWRVRIECRKGNYYLVHDGSHSSGWAVAGLAVLPVPDPDETWGPPQCSLFDEADH